MPPIGGWKSGVYMIRNKVNGKVYVGSAADKRDGILGRWSVHRSDLRKGKHHSSHLQRAWNRYGEEAFEFIVLLRCSPQKCLENEQIYLDRYQAAKHDFGYNNSPTAGNNLEVKRTKESKARMSEIMKRAYCSSEAREKLREAQNRPARKAKKMEDNKRRWSKPGAREEYSSKMKEAWKRPELRKKISDNHMEKLLIKAEVIREIIGYGHFTCKQLTEATGYVDARLLLKSMIKAGIVSKRTRRCGQYKAATYRWVNNDD